MKSEHQKRVEEFMVLAGQDVPAAPCEPSEEVRVLRAKLILEEALETVKALGVFVGAWDDEIDELVTLDDLVFEISEENDFNLEEVIDGCCDISVVTVGTLSACGVPDIPFLSAVDANNKAKFGPGGYRRDDGKWVKPPGHKPPDIAGILRGL